MSNKYYPIDFAYERVGGGIDFVGIHNQMPGINYGYFYIDFECDDKEYFRKGNVLVDNTGKYQIELIDEPINFKYRINRYKCRVNSTNPNSYIPVERLQKGVLWKKL